MGTSILTVDEKRQLFHKLSKEPINFLKSTLQKWPFEEIRQILSLESEKENYTDLSQDEIINILLKTVSEKNIGDLEVQDTKSLSTTRNSKKQRKDLDPLELENVTSSPKTKETNIEDLEVQETKSPATTRNSKKQRKNLNHATPSAKTKGKKQVLHLSEKNIGDLEVQDTKSSLTTRNSKKQRKNLDPLKLENVTSSAKVSKKHIGDFEVKETNSSPTTRNSKKRRKNLDRLKNVTSSVKTEGHGEITCKNWACKAGLKGEDTFCKKCSCCICLKYDEDKDTSLWLTCNSDPPFDGESCDLSFHLSCAFNTEKSGLKEDRTSNGLDGCILCVSCGKTNCLLKCLKKQLETAMEERRVNGLCCHLLMAQKLLKGTKKYKEPSEKVEKAVKLLETELGGPLTGLPEMPRARVNRLCSAKDVKDLCSSAFKLLDAAPPSLETESNRKGKRVSLEIDSDVGKIERETSSEERLLFFAEVAEKYLPVTPSCSDQINDREDRLKNVTNMENPGNCIFGFEQCVKLLRQLESSGYVDNIFRQRFLSWYGLRATGHEKHVVKTFVDTFKDDTLALADQLVDTFSDCISRKRSTID